MFKSTKFTGDFGFWTCKNEILDCSIRPDLYCSNSYHIFVTMKSQFRIINLFPNPSYNELDMIVIQYYHGSSNLKLDFGHEWLYFFIPDNSMWLYSYFGLFIIGTIAIFFILSSIHIQKFKVEKPSIFIILILAPFFYSS